MKFLKITPIVLLFISITSLADSISIQGMSCSGCEKQVRKAICMDKEMSTWFDTCDAKVTNAEKQIGEVSYSLKKGTTLDQAKMTKVTKAIEDTGRFVIKTESSKK